MSKSTLISVCALPIVNNVCNQILREVISLPKVSMAHVIMQPGNISLLHQHTKMTEVYFIISGKGILYLGNKAFEVKEDDYLVIPPGTPHKLKNTGETDLKHLVFAIPPFDPEDLELLEDENDEPVPQKFQYDKRPVEALDGAIIYELLFAEERKSLDVALAIGTLPPKRNAKPHFHKISEELYYVISGNGKARVGDEIFTIQNGSLIHVPINTVHALENCSETDELKILCVSSPAYTEGDFILA